MVDATPLDFTHTGPMPPIPEEFIYESQSGEAGQTIVQADTTQQTIAAFSDGMAGFKTIVEGAYEPTMTPGKSETAELTQFLNRPVKILDYDWLVGQNAYLNFNPWQLFYEDPKVADKIRNFNLLRSKLCVKFVINGVVFHYGRIMVSYNPLPNQDGLTVNRLNVIQDLVGASQKPKVFLNPTTCEGAEMCLPFFFFKNYMSVPDADYQLMGEMFLNSFDILRHANGGTDPVRITAYAWAEDVVLTMPTSLNQPGPSAQLVSQSGMADGSVQPRSRSMRTDEYGMGIISKPASAVAKAAGMLESIPLLAPYAKATSMVSSAIAGAARLFGYSRPPIISDIQLYKPFPQGNLANVDASEAVSRLTLDSKQELTVDPRTVGLGPQDQMSIKSIVTRESFLTRFSWDETNAPGDLLWNSYVSPCQFSRFQTEYHLTPSAMICKMFDYWHGTIKFRFQVVASAMHKGRILLRYDPALTTTPIEYNTGFTRIIDISEEPDFEIEVAWGQALPFLECIETATELFTSASRLPRDNSGFHNGIVELSVINTLASPTDNKPVSINVFVSMCDDAKFGAPLSTFTNYSVFPGGVATLEEDPPGRRVLDSQSGEEAPIMNMAASENKPTDPEPVLAISTPSNPTDETMSVFFGESITSIRELMKRYVLYRTYAVEEAGTVVPDKLNVVTINTSALPGLPGFDPSGPDDFGADVAWQLGYSPIAWLRPCYAAWRGSLRKKFFINGGPATNPFVYRGVAQTQATSISIANSLTDTFNSFALSRGGVSTYRGSAATSTAQNAVLEIEVPFYEDVRFLSARNGRGSLTFSERVTLRDSCNPSGEGILPSFAGRTYTEWVAAGEDFSLFFFTGVPILYRYTYI